MQPFDSSDHPMHGVIVTWDGITCASTLEPEFYSNVKSSEPWRDPTMCAYCAGSHGFEGTIDEDLYIEYSTPSMRGLSRAWCAPCSQDKAQEWSFASQEKQAEDEK